MGLKKTDTVSQTEREETMKESQKSKVNGVSRDELIVQLITCDCIFTVFFNYLAYNCIYI